jgi:hypothetical protein
MPNCKPGDLALVVAGQNLGALVEVVRAYAADPDGDVIWECTALSSIVVNRSISRAGQIVHWEANGTIKPGGRFVSEDRLLRPLRDGPPSPHDSIPLPEPAPSEIPGYLNERPTPEVLEK